MQGLSVDSIRRMAEDRIMAAVDGVLARIPNGPQYRNDFHRAIDKAIDEVQQQVQGQAGNLGGMLGNLGQGRQPDQPGPPVH